MHGRVSRVTHWGDALFAGIPRQFEAMRYHSLCLQAESIPPCLEVSASTPDGVVMAVRHTERPQFGVQFHPESVLAEHGERLIRNFLRLASHRRNGRPSSEPPRPRRPTLPRTPPRRSDRGFRVIARKLDRWVDPQQAFDRLFASSTHSFWLDSSAIVPGYSRFSYMGDATGPDAAVMTYRTRDRMLSRSRAGQCRTARVGSLLAELRNRLDSPLRLESELPVPFQTGLVGYLGYEMRNECGAPTIRDSALPDAALFDPDRYLAFDHTQGVVHLVARIPVSSPVEDARSWFDLVSRRLSIPSSGRAPRPRKGGSIVAHLADGPRRYARKVARCHEQLAAGESYQICLSSEFSVEGAFAPYPVYRQLRSINPAPYSAFLRFGEFAILSSSPERFLRVSTDRTISAKPIKGTCARGGDDDDDARLARWLRSDEKFRSENVMIVDLLRNDIGRVASTASVRVPRLMDVESYATVHQLVSTVTGTLRQGLDCLDCLRAAFPGGSMTGAPKLRTMSIIDRLEDRARGPYSGTIGFLSRGDRMDLSIVIRTIVIAGSVATVGSGGGIVAMSDPGAEFEEMVLKARAPLRALAAARSGSPDGWELRYLTS